jgi:FAD/FMN-containing dehydrogenase
MLARLDERLKSMQLIEDGCVPPPKLGAYVAGLRQAFDRNRIRGVIFGHAGDAHVHANALVDVTESDWRSRVDGILSEVTDLVASLGGSISGEHGDGRLRTPLLSRVFTSERLAEFAAIKRRYDPDGRMNPGVKVGAPPGIGDIKYDPSLPARSEAVTRAFTHVERARGYSEFRLSLL